ncbi:TOBE domain-containing protein [Flagellimonas myxillae]|uniref:TOBE domain-containing protein n=1 Tax=Flagellimonas myxillae TaxID=2942214 RepID=UPI00201EEF72|nr:TOBE domain-containing protein [Muricauda myxillae]MCL6265736.1 TOBE domain-containing protein [Muricauda myxillae]
MNSLEGTIVDVEVSGNLSLVCVEVHPKTIIKAIVVETPESASYLTKGEPIKTLFKETEVVIGVGEVSNISMQNRIAGTVKEVHKGTLLGKVVLDTPSGTITSVISSNAVEKLELEENTTAVALIKLNEVMLAKI